VLAAADTSAFVALHCACALQRLAPEARWPIARALVARADLAEDPNVPLMTWYGIEPLVRADLLQFVRLAGEANLPLVRRHVARRAASLPGREGLAPWAQLLAGSNSGDVQRDLLQGALEGLAGVRKVVQPAAWPAAYAKLRSSPEAAVRQAAHRLALVFDDPEAVRLLLGLAADSRAAPAERAAAIESLVASKVSGLASRLRELIRSPATRRAALRGLAEYDDPQTPAAILEHYASFDAEARQDALQTLASRPAWAQALLEAVRAGRVPRTDVSAYTARQMLFLESDRVRADVVALWGQVRETPAEKARLVAEHKQRLTPEALRAADPRAGRAVFAQACANCHRLFDAGGTIAPDLTGSQRTNVDYLLQNLIDPGAAIARDYQLQVIVTVGGRVVTGLLVSEGEQTLTIQTANERLVIPTSEIESRSTSNASLMPEGLLENLSSRQVQDLFAYLTGPEQVPLPGPGE
jgi:putative heme-binding domain-containing protein